MIINSSTFNFKDTVDDIIRNDYIPEVTKTAFEVIPKVAQEAAKRLKASSSEKFGSGTYSKGWAVKTEKGRLHAMATVYGKDGTYQLAHLLEHGHATRNGTGRIFLPTPAYPHIAEVDEWASNKAYNDIMDKLEKLP